MQETHFRKICQNRGFSQVAPRLYARCYGDGLYQTIYTGFRKYISPFSPNYSDKCRKSNYISIAVSSLYSKLPQDDTAQWHFEGCSPDELRDGTRPSEWAFNGIEEEYGKMCEFGFDLLDRMQSQQDFLDYWLLSKTGANNIRIHSLSLAIPFLMVGDEENALFEITHSYTNHSFAFHLYHDPQIERGEHAAYLEAVQIHNQEMEYLNLLWRTVLGRNNAVIRKVIANHFQQNLECVQKAKVPTDVNDRFGVIPEIFSRL